jgi:chemotaxis receptor (MCP) glutamine deamidase CheD
MRKNNEMILLIQGYIEDHKFRSSGMNHIVFNGKKKKKKIKNSREYGCKLLENERNRQILGSIFY